MKGEKVEDAKSKVIGKAPLPPSNANGGFQIISYYSQLNQLPKPIASVKNKTLYGC
jgi:hypothetical protein